GETHYHRHVFYHRLGSDPSADEEVFGEGRPRTHMPELALSLDGRWLLITVHCSRPACDDELFVLDRTTRELVSLSGPWRARYTAAFRGDEVLLCTNLDAPRGKLVAIDPQCPEPSHWRPVVSEHPQWVMMAARATGKHLWISWLDGATAVVTLHEPDGRLVGRVHWPDL
ncbi:Prolyl oligopeptidase, partial [mine drainage metagenome]